MVPSLHSVVADQGEGEVPCECFYALELDGPARALVHALKFEGFSRAAVALVERTVPTARLVGAGSCDVAVPVPLYSTRLRERGFNQADKLCRALGRRLGVPLDPSLLLRTRSTRPQTGLDRARRRSNVRGAFASSARLRPGTRVLLVDDVVTTGTTLREATGALLEAGAAGVVPFAPTGRPETG